MRLIVITIVFSFSFNTYSQPNESKFGKGFLINGQDSSYFMKIGFRFQTLNTNSWNLRNDDISKFREYDSRFLIRRSRLKLNGWAHTPKLKYKIELALSNRDNGGGNSSEFSNAANIILDAYLSWNFYKNLSIQVGQAKLPGNRERVISSANLQFVDRSKLNSRYTIDRDAGVQIKHHHKIGNDFLIREVIAVSGGEGKNITTGHHDGFGYTFRLEALPFGKFQSKGDYIGASIKREEKAKLAIGFTYDVNDNAVRERGQKGNFIKDENGRYLGKQLHTYFADLMFKYQGFSMMAEYAYKFGENDNPYVYDVSGNLVGTYYTGTGLNIQIGQMLKGNWEIAGRWTDLKPDIGVAENESQYTFAVSKYIVGHKLKVQSDVTYRGIDNEDDELMLRFQVDIHF